MYRYIIYFVIHQEFISSQINLVIENFFYRFKFHNKHINFVNNSPIRHTRITRTRLAIPPCVLFEPLDFYLKNALILQVYTVPLVVPYIRLFIHKYAVGRCLFSTSICIALSWEFSILLNPFVIFKSHLVF